MPKYRVGDQVYCWGNEPGVVSEVLCGSIGSWPMEPWYRVAWEDVEDMFPESDLSAKRLFKYRIGDELRYDGRSVKVLNYKMAWEGMPYYLVRDEVDRVHYVYEPFLRV